MNFVEIVSLVQVFANEWCRSGNNILIIGNCDTSIKRIFELIDCETFTVTDSKEKNFDFRVENYNNLPFEKYSFDVIVSFCDQVNFSYLKPDGVVLIKEKVITNNKNDTRPFINATSPFINAKGCYYLNGVVFSVI